MKPRIISLLVSFLLSLVVLAFSFFLFHDVKSCLILVACTFLSAFVFTLIAIDMYIARRIRLVYKLISNLKIDKSLKQALGNNISDDPLNQMEEDVSHWAQQQASDIEMIQKISDYRKEFLGNLSHEIKTPLFNIQGYIQSLINGGLEDRAITDSFLLKAEKNIDRLCALVADVDVMSKLDTGEMPLIFSNFDIVGLIKEIAFTRDELAKKKNIKFEEKRFRAHIWV